MNLSILFSNTLFRFPAGMTNRVLNFFIFHGGKEQLCSSLINYLEVKLSVLLQVERLCETFSNMQEHFLRELCVPLTERSRSLYQYLRKSMV